MQDTGGGGVARFFLAVVGHRFASFGAAGHLLVLSPDTREPQ